MYPKIIIDLNKLNYNIIQITDLCHNKGIKVAGVVKGFNDIEECAKLFDRNTDYIASSRIEHLIDIKRWGFAKDTLMIRIPMISEADWVVRYANISLNSDIEVLNELNRYAKINNVIHRVILMIDLGDLREGFWDKDELIFAAEHVENDLKNLYLEGIGTNLGCYGSVLATKEKLQELVEVTESVEKAIGRKVDIISGGATSSLMRVIDGDIPERINMLRLGEGIILARDLPLYYGYDMSFMYQDVFTLKTEVLEVRDKPSHPVGTIAVDAFGRKRQYKDRGIRKRAVLGIGRADYGSIEDIFPRYSGVEVLGASSDHTIIDVEDCEEDIKTGDILEFDVNYGSLLYLTNSKNVKLEYV